MSKETLGSRNSRSSKNKSKKDLGESRVERYINLKNPTMKQTLALFKEKVNSKDVDLLKSQVKNKRSENKELLQKIKDAENMLKNLEIRQERVKTIQKKKSKIYKKKAISAIRKIGSMPGKKQSGSLFIKNLQKHMMEREKKNEIMRNNKKQKELKKKQRKAIEEIIKEGIENEKLKRRLNDALKRFTKKLDEGQIDSALMDEELERILDLRRIASQMGVYLFGDDLEEEEIRDMYRKKDYRVFQPNDEKINQSVFLDQESLDAIDEIGIKNRSVNIGNRSMNVGRTSIHMKGKTNGVLSKTGNILAGDLKDSKFWKTLKPKTKRKRKKSTLLKKSKIKGVKKPSSKKGKSNVKYKTKSGKLYIGRHPKPKKSKSTLKRSKSPLSKSQYKLINEKKKKLKKSLVSSRFGDKNISKRLEKKKKLKKTKNVGKSKSSRSQKSYADKYEEKKSKREFSRNKRDPIALGFESFKGGNSSVKSPEMEKSVGQDSNIIKKSKFSFKSKSKPEIKKKGVKLYINKLQDKLKRKKTNEKIRSRSRSRSKKKKSKPKKKSKSKVRTPKLTVESQIVNESQVNEILTDNTFGYGSGSLKNSKMSLLSGQFSRKKIEKKNRSYLARSGLKKKSKSKSKIYKSNVNTGKKKVTKKQFASTKKGGSRIKKAKTPKKGSMVKIRKKKIKKNDRGKSEDKLTNSDFRRSNIGQSDSMVSGDANVNIKNGKLLAIRKNKREVSAEVSRENTSRGPADYKSRKTQRSADVMRQRQKNQLIDFNENKIETKPKKKNLIVHMSLEGDIVLKEGKTSVMEDDVMKEKLAELDEFVRSSSKKEKMVKEMNDGGNIRNWDEALGNVEREFEKNLKDSSDRMIDTKKIDEELRKLEEMEKSFEIERQKEIEKFENERKSILEEEREKDLEDQNVEKIISFGTNNEVMMVNDGRTSNHKNKLGLSLTEKEIQLKLQPFDKRKIFCSPEMLFSYNTKNNIQSELIKVGRDGLRLTDTQRDSIMNELLGRVKKENKKIKINEDEFFEQNGSGREVYHQLPTAEFKTNSGKKINSRNSHSYNDFKINTFNFEKDEIHDPYLEVDITRQTIVGRNRDYNNPRNNEEKGFNDFVMSFQDKQTRFFKDETEDRKREVIIQKLNESGVHDPSMGKPELQKTMRTLESEFNSIPENLREFR
jgi:hypothetical protein